MKILGIEIVRHDEPITYNVMGHYSDEIEKRLHKMERFIKMKKS